jgi:hypothetical protein
VSFRSKDSFALPLNTTKRGLDTSSEVYLYVLDYMREGMKLFTNFTNKWKTHEDETGLAFSKLEKMKFSEIVTSVDASQWKQVRRGGTEVVAKRFIPDLPKPVVKESLRKISFSRPLEHIDLVSQHLNLEADTKPSDVGAHCFDLFFEETQQ